MRERRENPGLREVYAACREEINTRPLTAFVTLEKSRGRQMYCCPLCGSGTGRNHTGALRLYSPQETGSGHWNVICFANRCFGEKGTDTLGALRILNPGLSEWALFQQLNLHSLAGAPAPAGDRAAAAERPAERPTEKAMQAEQQKIEAWAALLPGSEGERYLLSRGITRETMEKYRLGYDPRHYFGKLGAPAPAVILPYPGRPYWAARAIGEKAFDKPRNAEAGSEPLFNGDALQGDEPVFVVESQICALSILQAGGTAVALGNTGGGRLVEAAAKEVRQAPLILCLDNDPQPQEGALEKGPRAQAELAEALRRRNIPFLEINIAGHEKDPNDALQREPEAFRSRVASARQVAAVYRDTLREQEAEREREAIARAELSAQAERLEYERESSGGHMEAFRAEVQKNRDHPPIPTGFPALDKLLDGGLYPGLYIVGAITSLGKTSFVLQLADQIAARGQDVLFFSLEMSQYELMAKSVSRLTFQRMKAAGEDRFCAKTTRGILTGKRYEHYLPRELAAIEEAQAAYEQIGGHIWFTEGIGDVSTGMIRERVDRHIAMTGRTPVVIVDYLQIMTPVDIRATDKQNTDRNVLEMKRLSRDRNIPVIGISSLNRENYMQPINLAAFKEAGSIEYGSDCLIGLQYEGMDYTEGEAEKAREKRIRELMRRNEGLARDGKAVMIQLKILKNRNGSRGSSAPLLYFPMFNHFEEMAAADEAARASDPFGGAPSVPLRR